VALPFFSLLFLFCLDHLLLRLFKVPTELNDDVEQLMWLPMFFVFSEVFKEFGELNLGSFHAVTKERHLLDSRQSKKTDGGGSKSLHFLFKGKGHVTNNTFIVIVAVMLLLLSSEF
jgi:hypothetical protein